MNEEANKPAPTHLNKIPKATGPDHSSDPNPKKKTLSRSMILRGKNKFRRLFDQGFSLRARNIDLRYIILEGDQCLMGFVVGRRLGKAHKRNQIKRRMREAYRLHYYDILEETCSRVTCGFHAALIAKNTKADYQAIERDCIRLLTILRDRLNKKDPQRS